ncbi:MAG TPA: T9SS type A sorting domain-containing protein, partial [Adhaeribacter sp.]|nr:T9SS type A sorting domain-containing protein [Adhaeribacter sp.]
PFRSQLSVQLQAVAAGKAELQLTDALGRVIMQKQVLVKAGVQAFELALPEKLADGMYLLQVQHLDKKMVLKVMKN